MTRIIGLFAFVALAVIALSCASDIFLEESESLTGEYEGIYVVTVQREPPEEHKQRIVWTFRGGSYNMTTDSTHENWNEEECICKVYGKYEVTNKVTLTQATEAGTPHAGCNTCRESYDPKGAFGVEWSRDKDTLKLTRTDTDKEIDLRKQLLLWRATGQ